MQRRLASQHCSAELKAALAAVVAAQDGSVTIRETALEGRVVVTRKLADANLMRPFETFTTDGGSKFFATEATALQGHSTMVGDLRGKRSIVAL